MPPFAAWFSWSRPLEEAVAGAVSRHVAVAILTRLRSIRISLACRRICLSRSMGVGAINGRVDTISAVRAVAPSSLPFLFQQP